jgi:uncharacterized protein
VRLRLLVLAGCAIVGIGAFPAAAAPSCTGLPKHTAIPVVDAAKVIKPEAEAYLAADLMRFHIEGHEVIVVATVPDLGGDDVASYARRLFDCWGVGDADSDNGVLVLVAMRERRARIEVGAGLGEALAQERLDVALAALVTPMRAGDVAGGLRAAAASLADDLGGELPDTARLAQNPGTAPVDDVPDGAAPSFAVPVGGYPDTSLPFGGSSGDGGIGFAAVVPFVLVIGFLITLLRALVRGGIGGGNGGGNGGGSTWRGGFSGTGWGGGRWDEPTMLHRGGWSGWGPGGSWGSSWGGPDDSDDSGSDSSGFGGSGGSSDGGGSFGGGSSGGGGASGSW